MFARQLAAYRMLPACLSACPSKTREIRHAGQILANERVFHCWQYMGKTLAEAIKAAEAAESLTQ